MIKTVSNGTSIGPHRTGTFALVFLLVTAVAAGCAGAYGRLQQAPEMTTAFQEGRILPNHRYYITGRDHMPYAILALAAPYRQVSRRWQEISPSSEALARLARNVFNSPEDLAPRASAVLDNDGNTIGYYYSGWYYTSVKIISDSEVTVFSPYSPAGRIGED